MEVLKKIQRQPKKTRQAVFFAIMAVIAAALILLFLQEVEKAKKEINIGDFKDKLSPDIDFPEESGEENYTTGENATFSEDFFLENATAIEDFLEELKKQSEEKN